MAQSIRFTLNGKPAAVEAEPSRPLLWLLRDDLGITGPKYGCGEGLCGACTVLIEGRAVRSCITPALAASGKKITTIEGLAQGGKLHPVQQAFLDADAFQCGYCTGGMILSTVALLENNPRPTDDEIKAGLEGNVCRCCVYPMILDAVKLAAGRTTRRG